jgi:hypothetical protein
MRTLLLVAATAALGTSSALAATIEPSATATVPPAAVIAYDEAIGTSTDPLVRLFGNQMTVTTCLVAEGLTCDATPSPIAFDGDGDDANFHLTSASSGRLHTVLADGCGRILEVTANTSGEFAATTIIDEIDNGTGRFVDLERPAMVAVVGDEVFFSSAKLSDGPLGASNCTIPIPEPLGSGQGAFIQAHNPFDGNGKDQTVLQPSTGVDHPFHPQASRGVSVYLDEDALPSLWTASGSFPENETVTTGHIARWTTANPGAATLLDLSLHDLPVPVFQGTAAIPRGIGQPRFVAPLRVPGGEPKVVVGGTLGLVVFTLEGRYLGPLWLNTDRGGPLAGAKDLLSLTAAPDGTGIFALFEVLNTRPADADNRGTLLAEWKAEDVEDQLGERVIRVEGKQADPSPTCERDDPIIVCSDIQAAVGRAWDDDTITVEAGFYDGGLNIFERGMTLVAETTGKTVIFQPNDSGSVILINSVDDAMVTIDGFMITAGAGTVVKDEQGNDQLFGGGVFAVDSNVRIKRSLITHNSADFGGGIAAIGDLIVLDLENVGLTDNSASGVGGAIATAGNDPVSLTVSLLHSTLAGNCSGSSGAGLGAFENTLLEVDSSIAGFNGDEGLPLGGNGSSATVSRSDLYFDPPMNQDDLDELGSSNVSVDPQFVNLADRDLRLSAGTPASFNNAELGLYGGASGNDLSFTEIPTKVIAFCDLDPGDDDDDASDDDDSGEIGTGNEIALPSGLRCTNCNANMTGASASTGLLLLPLVAVRRRRKR